MSRSTKRNDKPFVKKWGKHHGKEYKRRLSKAMRKYVKMQLDYGQGKFPTGKISNVNYRGW